MSARKTDRDQPELAGLDAPDEQRLIELLRNALAPLELDRARHERLLQAAFEDPFAPASADEVTEGERLRRALASDGNHLDLDLARAVAAAHAPNAVARKPAPPAALPSAQSGGRTSRWSYIRFGGALAGFAAAAALVLAVTARRSRAPAPDLPALALAQSRSTAPLFRAAFAEPASARIDRIAGLRARELRDNRYALWGVR